MNRRQKSYMKMWRLTRNTLGDNYDIWKEDTGMLFAVEQFDKYYKEIDQLAYQQSAIITGITTKKNNMRYALIDKLIIFVSRIRSYAAVNDNLELFGKIKCSRTELKEMSTIGLLSFLKNIIKIAQKNLNELIIYGIDQQKIDALVKQQKEFDKYSTKPRLAVTKRSALTQFIKEQIPKLALYVRNVLDTNMLRYSKTHPEFYGKYQLARRLVGNPQHKSAVIGLIIDAKTKKPIHNVKIRFELILNNAIDKPYSKLAITTAKGNYRIKTLKTGRYNLVIMHPKYETIRIQIAKYPRQHQRQNFELIPTYRVDGAEYSRL